MSAEPSKRSVAHGADTILWDVVDEHVNESAYLLEASLGAMESPVYTLKEFRDGPEERLRAHLDALDVGGRVVAQQRILPIVTATEETEEEPELFRIAAAALAALELKDSAWAAAMLEALPTLPGLHQEAIFLALAVCDRQDLDRRLPPMISRHVTSMPAAVAATFAARGLDLGESLDAMWRSRDGVTLIAAARAALYTDRRRRSAVEQACTSVEPELRDAALPAALAMGSPHGWQVAARLSMAGDEVHRDAMQWVAQLGEARATESLIGRLDDADARPSVLWALGFAGWIEAADACTRWLADKKDGPLAGEAFAAITGLDLRDQTCWGDAAGDIAAQAEGDEELPPLEDDLETDLSLAPETELRVPNAEAIVAWWGENRGRFRPGQRYILGRPADEASLLHALRTESMRRRHARAFELLVRSRGVARVQTRMMSGAQYRQMDALGSLPRIDGNRPFSRIG